MFFRMNKQQNEKKILFISHKSHKEKEVHFVYSLVFAKAEKTKNLKKDLNLTEFGANFILLKGKK